jgi:hypothetical protein
VRGAAGLRAGFVLAVMLFAPFARAQDAPETQDPSGAAGREARPVVRAAVDTTATVVGGRLHVTLDVTSPEGWFVTLPEKDAEFGSFRLRGIEEKERTTTHRRVEMTLVATEAGDVEVPPISLHATRGDDPEGIDFQTEPIPVTVASNLSEEERAALPPLPAPGTPGMPPGGAPPPGAPGPPGAAPEGPPPAGLKPALEAPRTWWPVAAAGGALLLAALVTWLVVRRLRAREDAVRGEVIAPVAAARPAWEIALEELDAIAEARWVERGEPVRQYEQVTETLRRYLENRYGIPALESTTDDLREILRDAPIRGDLAARVLSLLSDADLVKFAKGIPDPAEAAASEGRVRRLVNETTPVREQPGEEAA